MSIFYRILKAFGLRAEMGSPEWPEFAKRNGFCVDCGQVHMVMTKRGDVCVVKYTINGCPGVHRQVRAARILGRLIDNKNKSNSQ